MRPKQFSFEAAKAEFEYNPAKGLLTRNRKTRGRSPSKSASTVQIAGERYSVGRVCWLLGWGADGPPVPTRIGLIDGDKTNLKLENLTYQRNNKHK
jgi:hypothetical protein